MPGLFQGLEIGKRALLAHQVTLQTIGHNISNVNTPGYTRQRVTIKTTLPEKSPIGSVGSGITASEVRNIKDLFLGDQLRQENKSLGSDEGLDGVDVLLLHFWDAGAGSEQGEPGQRLDVRVPLQLLQTKQCVRNAAGWRRAH